MTVSTFRHYLLTLDENSQPLLERQETGLQPGRPHPASGSGQVLLAGGFSAISPGSDLPLSPTLQVNGDLGSLDEQQITALALAELQRHHNTGYRSTSREADNRVCVLAADAGALRHFIDTYGGVLTIHPLLVAGSDPDFTTATELTITPTTRGVRLDFLERVPVDRERCTYCGSCGPVCPRQCLSPTLFLDLERCDFCNLCVRACPHQAIDLHGVRQQRMEIPALLLLDGVNVDERPGTDRIYHERQIERLFASIFTCRIEEVITCDNRICQYSVRTGKGCDRCLAVCRHRAVTRNQAGIRIDQGQCVECGLCVGACPTGALQYHRFDDQAFLDFLATLHPGTATTLVLAAEADLHHFWWHHQGHRFADTLFLEFPRLAALHLMHLLATVAAGFGRLLLLDNGSAPLLEQVDQANRICAHLTGLDRPIRQVRAGELPRLLAQRAPAGTHLLDHVDRSGRRKTLAALLERMVDAAGRPLVLEGALFPAFGTLRCDPGRCTLCLACLGDCRIGGLQADRERFVLRHQPLLCVQCGACSATCPEDALVPDPGLEIVPDRSQAVDLARAEPMLCRHCGRMFGTRQSHDRVLRLLQAHNLVTDEELYEYCETCRVVRIYEGAGHE